MNVCDSRLYVIVNQAACVKYISLLQHLVAADIITLSQLQTSFHRVITVLSDINQVMSAAHVTLFVI